MKPTITWILIADGARARVLRHTGPGNGLSEIEGLEFSQSHKRAQDIMADKPGRSHSSVGHGRSAMEYSSDPVREEQQKFTAEVAGRIDDYAAEGAFDRLVVCAAPQTLGDLRNKLSDKSRTLTMAEIDKNFSNLPTEKLISSVRSIMFDA